MGKNYATSFLNDDEVTVRKSEVGVPASFDDVNGLTFSSPYKGMNRGASCAIGIGIATNVIDPKLSDWTTEDQKALARVLGQKSQHIGSPNAFDIRLAGLAELDTAAAFGVADQAANPESIFNSTGNIVNKSDKRIEIGERLWGAKEGFIPYLLFGGDSIIDLPTFSFDASADNKIELTIDRTDVTTDNADLIGTNDGLNYLRLRNADFRVFLGGAGGNIGAISYSRNQLYNVVVDANTVVGTADGTFTPVPSGTPLNGSVAVGSSGVSTGMKIGTRDTGVPFVGRISDVKIYTNNVLAHHWPINEGQGTVINDIIGGVNGTLTIGSGSWVTS